MLKIYKYNVDKVGDRSVLLLQKLSAAIFKLFWAM